MAGPNEASIAMATRDLVKEVERLRQDNEKLINERFATLLKQTEKNEGLIRINAETLKSLPGELDKTLREVMAKEFSSERSLEMARKILDGLRQGMHLFLGGTLSTSAKPGEESGLVPASAFPIRPPNRFTAAAKAEEEGDDEDEERPKKRETTASFSIDKKGKMDISVDTSSRAAVAAAILAIVSAVGWAITAIMNQARHP
jgi:hypothetical protein